ncbi:Uncharacterised protein [Mycobacteroides abscessus subsp. massiliense]|nr:Uncharacterised protein [Mycobacteroides abscessus subsp. massiliense]
MKRIGVTQALYRGCRQCQDAAARCGDLLGERRCERRHSTDIGGVDRAQGDRRRFALQGLKKGAQGRIAPRRGGHHDDGRRIVLHDRAQGFELAISQRVGVIDDEWAGVWAGRRFGDMVDGGGAGTAQRFADAAQHEGFSAACRAVDEHLHGMARG